MTQICLRIRSILCRWWQQILAYTHWHMLSLGAASSKIQHDPHWSMFAGVCLATHPSVLHRRLRLGPTVRGTEICPMIFMSMPSASYPTAVAVGTIPGDHRSG